jgi:DOPA 4,5-dioxygenase
LWERIRRECKHPVPGYTFQVSNGNVKSDTVPELRIYTFFDKPVGPHPVAMFEVNLFTPAQFGAFVPWLVINRGPLSALIHPNTHDETEEERNHTQRATWLGDRIPLDLRIFKLMKEAEKRKEEEAEKEKAKAGSL